MGKTAQGPSSNWEKLKKKLPAEPKAKDRSRSGAPKKRKHGGFTGVASYLRKPQAEQTAKTESNGAGPSRAASHGQTTDPGVTLLVAPSEKPIMHELRTMVAGNAVLNEAKKAPGNYVAIDCEMVGCGYMGSENVLARISLVNYHGHVLLDTFVQPREKVTDWRTWVSGVREEDMRGAPSFEDVQKQVAKLIEGRILIGHAVENDLKSLYLSHPNPLLRDTQKCKPLREHAKTKRPGLKRLTELELGLKIQDGAHSSVTDARATMALYRLYKPEWEASLRHVMESYREKTGMASLAKGKKRRRGSVGEHGDDDGEGAEPAGEDGHDEDGDKTAKRKKKDPQQFPGGGRKGISSGLSVVIKRFGKKVEEQPRRRGPVETKSSGGSWWEEAAA